MSLHLNIGIFKAAPGCLQLAEIVIGAICNGLFWTGLFPAGEDDIYLTAIIFFMGSFALAVTTFLLFLSSLFSPMSANLMPKTIFESVHHVLGCIFLIAAGLSVFITSVDNLSEFSELSDYIAMSVLGVVNGILYGVNAHYSLKSFKDA